jgi:ADP-heptose:LPS heptosyltransferase
MRILVVKRDKIGDLLLTTPLIAHLKRSLPDARIDVLANDYNAWVVADNPHVARVWIYRRARHAGSLRASALLQQVRQFFALRREHFDVAIAAGGEESPRAVRRALTVRAKRTIAYVSDPGRYGSRLSDALPNPSTGHEVERMLALAAPLGVDMPRAADLPHFEPPKPWLMDARRWLAGVGFLPRRFIVLGLSARDAAKQPSVAQALRWAKRFRDDWSCATALASSPGDASNALYPGSAPLAQQIMADAPLYIRPIPDGIAAAVGVIALARTSVLPDSGLMHFAAASEGGVLGLFADPERLSSPSRWGPRGPRALALVAPRTIEELDDATIFGALSPLLSRKEDPVQQ